MNCELYEIMAPVGSRESLAAAINAGADSIYFGIEKLNMRAHSASTFTIEDLKEIAALTAEHGIKSYLTVNTIIYGEDLEQMREIIDAAKEANISAVIASDVAVMMYCKQVGQEVHLSTQLNISNIEALRFYAQFADVVVLARELRMDQVKAIHEQAVKENICGPSGNPIRIEMFCHGALCMAISGKCYLSLHNANRSANRGECVQICRRGYKVNVNGNGDNDAQYLATDVETGNELLIDNKYIMSPKDLKTIRFIDKMMDAGVRVFKIEGRARGPEYVDTVVRCYKEAIKAVLHDGNVNGNKAFTEEAKDAWDERLSRVFNRGFWDGYYQGQTLGEWNDSYGSKATEKKVYAAKTIKYFSKIGVAELQVEAHEIKVGDKLLITGPTTGAMYIDEVKEIRYDLKPVDVAKKGQRISIAVPDKVRPKRQSVCNREDKRIKKLEKLKKLKTLPPLKMTINEIQDEVIEEFSAFDDWMDKYQMLIDLGNEQEPLDEKYKTEQNLIDGCQSRVWVQCDKEQDGTLSFLADSDALIVKGIIALLIKVINHQPAKEILDADLYFIEQIGLKDHLSPTRSNGLLAMVKRIKAYALAYSIEN